ncbi:MAG: hypothetical protein ACXABY_31435 [Candidatus Thorarchaeota archaeon]|jgi:hypothetical protein
MNDENRQFYYIRSNGEPTVTVCLLKRDDGNWARGVAVCSPLDNPMKKLGRSLAENRAKGAIAANHTIPFGTYRSHSLGGVGFSSVYEHQEQSFIKSLLAALEVPELGGVEDGVLATPVATLTQLELALTKPKTKTSN